MKTTSCLFILSVHIDFPMLSSNNNYDITAQQSSAKGPNRRFYASKLSPVDSGLTGPVTLEFMEL